MIPSKDALNQLASDLRWFFLTPELRVLHVETKGEARPVDLHLLAMSEGHPANKSPFFVLEDAHLAIEPGWLARAERLVVIHGERRELLAKEGITLAELGPAPGTSEFASFGARLAQCLTAQRDAKPLDGLVVVLAPGVVEQAQSMADSMVTLVREPALERVRYIVLELGDAVGSALARALGAKLMTCERTLEAPPPPPPPAPASDGPAADVKVERRHAGPRGVVAPDVAAAPTELPPELAKQLGPEARLVGKEGTKLRNHVLAAAAAAKDEDLPLAIARQREAVKAVEGLGRLSCVLELILGSYQLQAKRNADANDTFKNVAVRAEAAELFDVAALACLSLGSSLAMTGVTEDAFEGVREYTRAANFAEKVPEPLTTIESLRMAGQLSLRIDATDAAIASWKRALLVADVAPPHVAKLSSAAAAARALAKVMIDQGAQNVATSLLEDADALERGKPRPSVEKRKSTSPPPAEAR